MSNEYSLYHYGVKGMRWGQRRQKRIEEREALKAKRKDQLERWKKDPQLRKEVRAKKRTALKNAGAHFVRGSLRSIGIAKLNDVLVAGLVSSGKSTAARIAHLTIGVGAQILNEASTIRNIRNEYNKAKDW